MALDPEKVIAGVLAGATRGQEGLALCARGDELHGAADLDTALACFDRALRHDVTLVPAWVGRSRILNARKRDKEAFACVNRALDVDPRFAPALVLKAEILRGRGLNEEALACYEAALGSGAQADAQTGRAAVLQALGREEVARPVPKPAAPLVEDRGPPSSRRRLDPRAEKKSIREEGRTPKKSVRTESRPDGKAITSDPLVARKSDPAMALGAHSSSIPPKRPSMRMTGVGSNAPVRRATQAEDDIATLEEVRTLVLGNRHVEGLRKLEPIAQRLPSAREPWLLRGHILFALKQYDAALTTAERVARLDPTDREALVLIVRALAASKKDVRALEMAERLLAIAPDDPDVHRMHADCLVAAMRHADAVTAYEKVLQLVPEDPAVWLSLGRTLRLLRRVGPSRAALNEAIALAEQRGEDDLVTQAREVLAKLPPG